MKLEIVPPAINFLYFKISRNDNKFKWLATKWNVLTLATL